MKKVLVIAILMLSGLVMNAQRPEELVKVQVKAEKLVLVSRVNPSTGETEYYTPAEYEMRMVPVYTEEEMRARMVKLMAKSDSIMSKFSKPTPHTVLYESKSDIKSEFHYNGREFVVPKAPSKLEPR